MAAEWVAETSHKIPNSETHIPDLLDSEGGEEDHLVDTEAEAAQDMEVQGEVVMDHHQVVEATVRQVEAPQ